MEVIVAPCGKIAQMRPGHAIACLGGTLHGKPPYVRPDTPISLGTFYGSESGKYPAVDLSHYEFILRPDRAGILASPCNPPALACCVRGWEIRVTCFACTRIAQFSAHRI